MKNFAKSILNYFAAFNETRFRFSRKLPYEWTDDSFTLDFSVFPDFQRKLIDTVATGNPLYFEIKKEQYTVAIDHDTFITTLKAEFSEQLNKDFLQNLINENTERLKESFPEENEEELHPSAEGIQLSLFSIPEENEEELYARAIAEGLREYNLTFRRRLLQFLTEAQDQKLKELQNNFGFHSAPPSSFNPQREVQNLYDDLKKLIGNYDTPESYISAVVEHIMSQSFGYVVFDLHPILRSFLQLIGTQSPTVCVFPRN